MPNLRYFIKVLPVLLFFFGAMGPGWAQSGEEDPSALIGLTLEEVLSRFGPPRLVYPVRGLEEWQDDVVFEYENRDLYIHRDRVWQVGLTSAYGITRGDPRSLALLVLGERARNFDGYIAVSFPGGSWPLRIRVNIDSQDKVAGVFIYRSDF
ncbi:MAG: hypothetical protein LBD65_01275 [Spirochaetaceae bacterium]|jgi:hypothetical protein|nr:hypothetical protein [Spirochaetaceae bacterium]